MLDTRAVEEYVLENHPDIIIHAAVVVDNDDAVRINTQMYRNIVRMRGMVQWIFNLNSGAAYGAHLPLNNVTEPCLGIVTPVSDYGYSKLLMAQMGELMGNVTDLFLFGIYGPLEAPYRFPKSSIQHILKGQEPVVFMDRLMSYLWIDDFVEILNTLVILAPVCGLKSHYNVTPDTPVTLVGFGNTIIRELCTSKYPPTVRVISQGMVEPYVGENTKIRELFLDKGFKWPCTPLEGTIQKMAEAMKEEH